MESPPPRIFNQLVVNDAAATKCKSCEAQVIFVPHERGKTMCLNAAPDQEKGNVMLIVDGFGRRICRSLGPRFAETHRAVGTTLYLSHHASCPAAGEWQRRAAVGVASR